MMKPAAIILLLSTIGILGLTDPSTVSSDPVPPDQFVAHSIHCAGCHGYDPTGLAMTDAAGNDVNMYDDWRISMMSLSAWDPFWRATLRHEVSLFPDAQNEIEQTCLRCHAPLGSQQRAYEGLTYSYAQMLEDSLGLDGVSCVACHQQKPETYGKSHSGHISLNTDRLIYGPHPEPFQGPMELYVGFAPVYTDLIYGSGVCAGCHTLITGTLDANGQPSGDFFVEQATYHEWLNSSYAIQGTECQNCHLPFIEDSVVLATDLKYLDPRSPYGVHQFHGANTAMLTLMNAYQDSLGLPVQTSQAAWDESILNNRASLRAAAELQISAYDIAGDTMYLTVQVVNKTGHKLPSGYPSRVAWLQVILTEDVTGDTLYANGIMDSEGNIGGRDVPYEPHHAIAHSAEDVQIYEMVMSDLEGSVTTRLNAAYRPQKDNRLLPKGFRRNHAVYDTCAIYGSALSDPDYGELSAQGGDVIEYRVPLNGQSGVADLEVSLRYHTFPARWMHDLFTNDGVPEIQQFEKMYADYRTFSELIDRIEIEDLLLDVSEAQEVEGDLDVLGVYPNPVRGDELTVLMNSSIPAEYEIYHASGQLIQRGVTSGEVIFEESLRSGVYLIAIRQYEGLRIGKFVVVQE